MSNARFSFGSSNAHESSEHTKFENDVKDHPAFLELLQLHAITANAGNSDSAIIAEKERRLGEIIVQLQKAREQLLSQQEQIQNNKVSPSLYVCSIFVIGIFTRIYDCENRGFVEPASQIPHFAITSPVTYTDDSFECWKSFAQKALRYLHWSERNIT